MCRAQDYAWHLIGFECFLPTRCAQAPAITWFEPSEAELWHGSRKIIAARFGKREKLRCHHSADSVAPYVLTPRIAATIAIEPCHGFERTHFKRLTEYVALPPRPGPRRYPLNRGRSGPPIGARRSWRR